MTAPDPLRRLLAAADGAPALVTVAPDGAMSVGDPGGTAVLPGSFNPLHEGHRRLAAVAAEITGGEVLFELSVTNVDKPPLKEAEVRRRVRQFAGKARVVLDRAPTFVEKARLLPARAYVGGWDTAVRLVEPRYYGGSEEAMLAALAELRALNCRFLIAGRELEGSFRTLADVAVPAGFEALFEAIPERRFRSDLSSTRLRERAEEPPATTSA